MRLVGIATRSLIAFDAGFGMKIFFSIVLSLLVLLFAVDSHGDFTGQGHVHTLSESKEIFWNPDCRANNTCDLKRFTLTTMAHEIWFSDDPKNPTHGNGAIMEYETDSVDAIEKYAIVQFVKGCVFSTARNNAGRIERQSNYGVLSFGENVPLCFPRWVIDSQDVDPVYNSDPDFGRFYLLRWNAPAASNDRTQKYYGAQKPVAPIVYMTDYPAGAFVTGTGVKNTSLQFKTCIYKASEVPARTVRDDLNFARPLHCFEWQNVYVYDFATGEFQTKWVDQEEPVASAPQPNSVLLLGSLLLIAALSSAWWFKRRFFSPDANLL